MIRLKRSLIQGLTASLPTVASVQCALQQAIELEHATIPVYLYALYSLDAAKNKEIASIIHSVVIEEMLHMTLASNILNAIDGSPVIDKPGFIPTYPGPLPGGVESSLTVNLAPFSMTQLQTFLTIEEPENPLDFKTSVADATDITIGQFYSHISSAIQVLGDRVFKGSPARQIGPGLMHNAVVVNNVATAQWAIATIVQQGEGTSDSPKAVVGGGYAHYYRFMQIQKGALLRHVSDSGDPEKDYTYTGAPVPFDATGVYAVPANPALTPYPPGSQQAFLNDNFNYTYTSLLKALHAMFNGQTSAAQFHRAVALMMSMEEQAKAMMAGIPNPKIFTGPSFQYQPINPGI